MTRRTDRAPRQRLDEATRRAAILAAAGQAFVDAPYEQVRLAEVARDAGASEALVFRYFGSKADLYAAVVAAAMDRLRARQEEADGRLGAGASTRDRVRSSLLVYLDHIAEGAVGWAAPFLAPGAEPVTAVAARRAERERYVGLLVDLLGVKEWPRHRYAVWGYFGFLDGACLAWVTRGCPEAERHALVEAALGALEGALGDWAV